MSSAGWFYFLFTVGLAATLAGIMIHYARAKRRDRVEAPKYRMLEDDAEDKESAADDRR